MNSQHPVIRFGLATVAWLALAMPLANAFAQDTATPRPNPNQPQNQPENPDSGNGGTDTPLDPSLFGIPEEKPPTPEFITAWEPLNLKFLDAKSRMRIDLAELSGISKELIAFIKKYPAMDEDTRDRVMRALISIWQDYGNELPFLREAIAQITDLLQNQALAPYHMQLFVIRGKIRNTLAFLATGEDKMKLYGQLAESMRFLLTQPSLPVTSLETVLAMYSLSMIRLRKGDDAMKQLAGAAQNMSEDGDGPRKKALIQAALGEVYFLHGHHDDFLKLTPDLQKTLRDQGDFANAANLITLQGMIFAERDDLEMLAETRAMLDQLGDYGTLGKREIDLYRANIPGTRGTTFYLYQVQEDGLPRETSDFAGKHTLLVFWRSQQTQSAAFLGQLKQFVFNRYSAEQLNVVGIGGGLFAGETQAAQLAAAQQLGVEGRGEFLFDPTNSVARAYGVQNYPAAVLLDPQGRIVTAVEVSISPTAMNRLMFYLEINLELTAEQQAVFSPESGPEENTPEYRVLKQIVGELDFPADHLVKKAGFRSIGRAYLVLGPEGRDDVRNAILRKLLAGAPAAERRVLMNLRNALAER